MMLVALKDPVYVTTGCVPWRLTLRPIHVLLTLRTDVQMRAVLPWKMRAVSLAASTRIHTLMQC